MELFEFLGDIDHFGQLTDENVMVEIGEGFPHLSVVLALLAGFPHPIIDGVEMIEVFV